MHIKPIPLGLTILGIGLIIGAFTETFDWIRRNPVWSAQNPGYLARGMIIKLGIGVVALAAGVIGWLI